jgi:hypothetical protein
MHRDGQGRIISEEIDMAIKLVSDDGGHQQAMDEHNQKVAESLVSLGLNEASLRKATVLFEDNHEYAIATEYRAYGSDLLLHRSAHVILKEVPCGAEALVAQLGSVPT